MKRIIYSIIALLGLSTSAISQNALTVGDILLPQNGEATLTVNFKFDKADTYTGYQFDLVLPEQLEFVMKAGSSTIPKYEMGECHEDHTLSTNIKDGVLTILASSMNSLPLKTTSGVLLKFTIKAASSDPVIGTNYECEIKNIKITDGDGMKTELGASNFKVTISQYTILDEESTTAPTAQSNVDVLVRRTIKANEWSTICLPFAMTEAQTKEAFGDDVKLGDFTGYTTTMESNVITGITVNFDNATAIEANHPYVIKVSSEIKYENGFTVEGVDINPIDEPCVEYDNGKTGKQRKVLGRFVGTYVADFDFYNAANFYPLFLSGNRFYYATEHTKHMKAFRAFFDFDDYMPEAENSSARISLNFDEATGIKEVHGNTSAEGTYDLQGRKVEEPTNKGLYIVNGKKVVKK